MNEQPIQISIVIIAKGDELEILKGIKEYLKFNFGNKIIGRVQHHTSNLKYPIQNENGLKKT